jgi:four helix bundle protein
MKVRGFDLEERTARFGEAVVRFCRPIRCNAVTAPIVTQLVKAATSVGANYGEANDAESKKDFRHKIGITRKESKESMHFL